MNFMAQKTLISLDQHNQRSLQKQMFMGAFFNKPNGLECPQCKEELCDLPGRILLSYPPQIEVKCLKCNFVGSRY